jgi:hypothetical protein
MNLSLYWPFYPLFSSAPSLLLFSCCFKRSDFHPTPHPRWSASSRHLIVRLVIAIAAELSRPHKGSQLELFPLHTNIQTSASRFTAYVMCDYTESASPVSDQAPSVSGSYSDASPDYTCTPSTSSSFPSAPRYSSDLPHSLAATKCSRWCSYCTFDSFLVRLLASRNSPISFTAVHA